MKIIALAGMLSSCVFAGFSTYPLMLGWIISFYVLFVGFTLCYGWFEDYETS